MNYSLIKNPINTHLYLQLPRDFPVYCNIKLQKNDDLQCYHLTKNNHELSSSLLLI